VPLVGLRTALSRTTPRATAKARAALVAALVTVFLAACAGGTTPAPAGLPDRDAPGFFPTQPVTEAGEATQRLYGLTFVIAVIVFVLVEGLLIWITLRYRQRPTDDELPTQTHGSNPLEILWTIVPAITVSALFIAALVTLNEETEARAATPDVVVDVTAFRWQWTFKYADEGVELTGQGSEGPVMGLPINESVRIRLAATDVIHSFYVPEFLYKLDAVPGRTNEFDVVVKSAGTYTGQCAEFCGLNHYQMAFKVQAMERPDYEAWLVDQRTGAPGASVPPDATTITLTSVDSATFDPPTLSAPAGKSIVFNFVNADQAQPHNVAITRGQPDGKDWVGMPIAQAGQTATYVAPPIPAGSYEFFCSVHPDTMRGTLAVGGN